MEPFAVLGIRPGAGDEEVRRAYFARVREHPPERDPEGFKAVREAYERLRDAPARARELLDRFHPIAIEDLELPDPVPLTRTLILCAERRRLELLRRDQPDEL